MSKTFVIQAEKDDKYLLPAHSFGYAVIEAIKFRNWFRQPVKMEHSPYFSHHSELEPYNYVLSEYAGSVPVGESTAISMNLLQANEWIPIGSVEFCQEFYKELGVPDLKPLNIPQELWQYCRRKVYVDVFDKIPHGEYFCKSVDKIKSDINDKIEANDNPQLSPNTLKKLITDKHFYTEWVDDILSEWRVFVLRGKVLDIKCYSGNICQCPSMSYLDYLVELYGNNTAYTLDVMVYRDSEKKVWTDIIELHDFFGCGLYGFEDHENLLMMHVVAHNDILKRRPT